MGQTLFRTTGTSGTQSEDSCWEGAEKGNRERNGPQMARGGDDEDRHRDAVGLTACERVTPRFVWSGKASLKSRR